jgi:hypothetical protein
MYSLTEPELIEFLPRPAMALLFVYPGNEVQKGWTAKEDESRPDYSVSGPDEPIIFYPQTIGNACGLIGLLHCLINSPTTDLIMPGSDLDKLRNDTIPLQPDQRAQYIHDCEFLERAHGVAAQLGDTSAPPLGQDPGHGFIAFVKGRNGHLYELAGFRKGPIDRGLLDADEDVLSEKALRLGPLPYLKREQDAPNGVLNFSCTMLGPATPE